MFNEELYILATKRFLFAHTLLELKKDVVFSFEGKEIDIGNFRFKKISEFKNLRTADKIEFNEKYSQIDSGYLFYNEPENVDKNKPFDGKFERSNGPIGKPLNTSVLNLKKESKTCTISAFRVEPTLYNLYEKKIKELSKNNPSFKKTDYLTNLIINDLTKKDDDFTTNRNDILLELRNFSLQTSKIGNNINQIAHGLNIIKRKKNSYLKKDEKEDLLKYYDLLKNMSERYTIVVKKILMIKLF